MSIDIDKLNEAAKVVYDTGFARGKSDGREEHSHEVVEHVGRKMIELAGWQLRLAADLPGETAEEKNMRWRAANLARNIYGRTPGGGSFAGGRLSGLFDRACSPRSDIDIDAARELAGLCEEVGRGA